MAEGYVADIDKQLVTKTKELLGWQRGLPDFHNAPDPFVSLSSGQRQSAVLVTGTNRKPLMIVVMEAAKVAFWMVFGCFSRA